MARTLTRRELTAALAARQLLIERARLDPVEAIRRLTPLQGQEPEAPYIGLAARLDGFAIPALQDAIGRGDVVRTSVMRRTLHVVAADEYPLYAQLARQPHVRSWAKRHPDADLEQITAELGAWLDEPRTNAEIRERVTAYRGTPQDQWMPLALARELVPVVHVPPAGFWRNRTRLRFVRDRRPRPDPAEAATFALARYLAAFGPASRRDVVAWAKVPQRDFEPAWSELPLVTYLAEDGTELLDLPDQPLPPASTRLPVRFLPEFEQSLLSHDDRTRIMPPELAPRQLAVAGARTFTVDGRVAGSWTLEREDALTRVRVTQLVDLTAAQTRAVRAEAERTGRFCEPDATSVEVVVDS